MNYTHIYEIIFKTEQSFRRKSWAPCRKIRAANLGDMDYISLSNGIDGIIVEDCKRLCDCRVSIWQPENEDKKAEDWEIFEDVASNSEVERSVATEAQ